MRGYHKDETLAGYITTINAPKHEFAIKARSGDTFRVIVAKECWFWIMTNLDDVNRDSVPPPEGLEDGHETTGVEYKIRKYLAEGRCIFVEGTYTEDEQTQIFTANKISLLSSKPNRVLFEETHWWLAQISQMANKWLDDLFDDRRSYRIDDFSRFYRTNLNISGLPTDEDIQECATLSRLIYGLSSAYLLTGNERYYLAAKAGVEYQREAFRQLSHDGQYIFWAFGRRKMVNGTKLIVPSQNGDDAGTIPLYEQIYALAGLAQFYRVTLDWEVLEDIRRTVNTFQGFFYDGQGEEYEKKGFPGELGYFSHIDPDTMRPDSILLGKDKNYKRKNWNSVGDHIPAYLINLVLALDPLPTGAETRQLKAFMETCKSILEETSQLIVEKFPDPTCPYVNERFHWNWEVDHKWDWQQNRAIIGHNLKIAWNLLRVSNYFRDLERRHRDRSEFDAAVKYEKRAKDAIELAKRLGDDMARLGVDQIRSGVFDCVERVPKDNLPIEFTWGSHKDFWQQEQGILAYLILHGVVGPRRQPDDAENRGDQDGATDYRGLAKELMAFWNLYFLDRSRQGIFFRTSASGRPIIEGSYADKGGHAISGYHAFELNYLAHLYIRAYLIDDENADPNFCLYFRIGEKPSMESINVLPDFFPPGLLSIESIRVDGVERQDLLPKVANFFQIDLDCSMKKGCQIAVQFSGNT